MSLFSSYSSFLTYHPLTGKVDKLLAATGDKGALFIVVFLILVLIGLIVLVFKI